MSLNRIITEAEICKKSKKVLSHTPSRISRKVSQVSSGRGRSDQKITFNSAQNGDKSNFLLWNKLTCGGTYEYSMSYGKQRLEKKGLSITKGPTGTGDVDSSFNSPITTEVELPVWHRMTEIAFDSFLHQIDWILSKLQVKEYAMLSFSNSIPRYQDICQKLRIEILLAKDKLNLLTIPHFKTTQEEEELLHNLSNLKSQLTDLRKQYHSLIKNFGSKVNKRRRGK